MADAMPSGAEDRSHQEAESNAEAREGEAEAGEGEELHGTEEEKAKGTAEEHQESGEHTDNQKAEGDDAGEEEEEPGECGFCLFMKSGPCRDSFINWEKCVEQAEKDKEDMVEKCHKVTFVLKECMERNSDYYEPVLQAEKAMEEAALDDGEAVAPAAQGDASANTTPDLQVQAQSENQPLVDDSHSQAQVPTHVDTEEQYIRRDEQQTHASSAEHNLHTSVDAPSKASYPPDSQAAAQGRSSG